MAESEVVAKGIVWFDGRQPARDFFGCFPGASGLTRPAKVPAEAKNVRVDGHHQMTRRKQRRPQAEVNPVRWAHHPAQEEEQSLTSTGAGRVRQQVTSTGARRGSVETPEDADILHPSGQSRTKSPFLLQGRGKCVSQRTCAALERTSSEQQAREIVADVETVFPAPEATRQVTLIIRLHRRVRPETIERVVNLCHHGRHVSESQRRGKQTNQLLIFGLLITMNGSNRIPLTSSHLVGRSDDVFERNAKA